VFPSASRGPKSIMRMDSSVCIARSTLIYRLAVVWALGDRRGGGLRRRLEPSPTPAFIGPSGRPAGRTPLQYLPGTAADHDCEIVLPQRVGESLDFAARGSLERKAKPCG